eukprot:1103774-Pleurochrysis_carterae.AAC.1
MTPVNLIRAHEYLYGTGTKITVKENGTHEYYCEKSSSESKAAWYDLLRAAFTESAAEAPSAQSQVGRLTVDGVGPVCSVNWAAAYGLTKFASDSLLADANRPLSTYRRRRHLSILCQLVGGSRAHQLANCLMRTSSGHTQHPNSLNKRGRHRYPSIAQPDVERMEPQQLTR